MLPIGIVIPTRNAKRLLAPHIGQLRALVAHASQTVVVDSSEDGTLAYLQQELAGLATKFLQHPPGLYESWNYGIQQVTSPYVYISTAGDVISREGLVHLFETAQNLEADIVISPPEFRDQSGAPLPDKRWPVHDVIERKAIHQPILLDPWEVFLLQVIDAPKSLLGSSAANLYRTEVLRDRPFPTGYGHFGDVAWGIENALSTRLAVSSSVLSKFVVHASAGTLPIQQIERARAELLALAMRVMEQQVPYSVPAWSTGLRRFAEETARVWASQQIFDEIRHRRFPWFLTPHGWLSRQDRISHKKQMAVLRENLLSLAGNVAQAE